MNVSCPKSLPSSLAETAALRALGTQPLALALRALCLLDRHFAAGCTVQAALQQLLGSLPHAAHAAQHRALTSELT